MTTAVILLVSGVLIGAGISIIWRDARAKRRRAFVTKRDVRSTPDPGSEAEITISYDPQPAAAPAPPLVATSASAPALDAGEESPPQPTARRPEPSRPGVHLPLEQEWAGLQPALAAGVDKINAVLAPVRLSVAPTGEPSWSYKNRGYGAYRRCCLTARAWLAAARAVPRRPTARRYQGAQGRSCGDQCRRRCAGQGPQRGPRQRSLGPVRQAGGKLRRAPATRPRQRRGGERAGLEGHRRRGLGRAQSHQRRAGASWCQLIPPRPPPGGGCAATA
jgi:hypothetical protein